MKNLSSRGSICALVVGLSTLLSAGCAVEGGGYGYGGDMGYYEPYGAAYGGWESGYWVGPYGGGHDRDRDRRSDRRGAAASPHAYRSAPASHAMPSLPPRSSSRAPARDGRDFR